MAVGCCRFGEFVSSFVPATSVCPGIHCIVRIHLRLRADVGEGNGYLLTGARLEGSDPRDCC